MNSPIHTLNTPFDLSLAKSGHDFEILEWTNHPSDGKWVSIRDYCREREGLGNPDPYDSIMKNLRITSEGHVVIDDCWMNIVMKNEIRMAKSTQ